MIVTGSSAALADGVLHAFRGSPDGGDLEAPLVRDANGNLFGMTYCGGVVNNIGTVFELSPNGAGGYTYSQIYAFQYGVGDAELPSGVLAIDSAGNLYGTTAYGGAQGGVGAVFELSPVAGAAGRRRCFTASQLRTETDSTRAVA